MEFRKVKSLSILLLFAYLWTPPSGIHTTYMISSNFPLLNFTKKKLLYFDFVFRGTIDHVKESNRLVDLPKLSQPKRIGASKYEATSRVCHATEEISRSHLVQRRDRDSSIGIELSSNRRRFQHDRSRFVQHESRPHVTFIIIMCYHFLKYIYIYIRLVK